MGGVLKMRNGGGEKRRMRGGRRQERDTNDKREELQKLGQERRMKYWEDAAEKGGRASAGE